MLEPKLKPDPLMGYMQQKLEQRSEQGNLRKLFLAGEGIDFFSNDYLGFAAGRETFAGEASHGATGSRLLSGNSAAAMALEDRLARYYNQEAALLFNSGYDANLGLFGALANRHTTILYDEYCHASILDGIRLSYAKKAFRFRHNDLADLEKKLALHSEAGHPLMIAVESLYSMEGSIAPLEAVINLAERYEAAVIVDEAHATGVFGLKGEGLVQQLGLEQRVFARVHTFGKALGCHGAVVAGSTLLRDYLVNFARSFIYTTALPAPALHSISHAYLRLQQEPETIDRLQMLTRYFGTQAAKQQLNWLTGPGPIQSLLTGSNERASALAAYLQSKGLLVAAVRSPTVPEGRERVRICLHAFNTPEQIDLLSATIQSWSDQHP